MGKLLVTCSTLFLLTAGLAQAEEALTCRGSITSKQGEGLKVQTFRFDVTNVAGKDMKEMLENCKKIAQQRQNKAGRANPAVRFKKFSDLDLNCTRGAENFQVRRTLQTAP